MVRGSASVALVGLLTLGHLGCGLLPGKQSAEQPAGSRETVDIAAAQPPGAESAGAGEPGPRQSLLRKLLFWWPQGRPKPPKAIPLGIAGSIYLVNEPGGFVVIESGAIGSLMPGTILSTLDGGRVVSTVEVGVERRPPFAIGEILSGRPKRGDSLYLVQ